MAKQDKTKQQEIKLEEPKATPAPTQEAERGYTVGLWGWKDQYRCKQCDFDSLDLDVMLQHLQLVHAVFTFKEPASLPSNADPEATAVDEEKADGIYEVDLKEDHNGTTNID